MTRYRFAFDLGTNSIGWAVFELDAKTGKPIGLAQINKRGKDLTTSPLGVRIFEDGRSLDGKKSKAELRQGPRSARRGQDRRLARRAQLMDDLERAGWMPPEGAGRDALFALDPYEIRARAAREKVSLPELARALWHISKHRGFKSNRQTDEPKDDSGLIKAASTSLREKLRQEGHATYGAYLYARVKDGLGVRVRPSGEKAEKHYEFYPTREMLLEEFDAIWSEQSKHHALSDSLRDRLRDYTIFYQRELKPVPPGRCTFFPDKDRLARWHPSAQAFLTLQDLANLRVICGADERPLDMDNRKVLFDRLNGGEKLTWAKVRRVLGLSSQDEFNLQSGGRNHLHFNQVAASLSGTARKPGPLAGHWPSYNAEQREAILNHLAQSESSEDLIGWLMQSFSLDRGTAEAVERIPMPEGYLRFCKDVTEALVAELSGGADSYFDAVSRAPLLSDADISHSEFRPDEGIEKLPHYNELEHLRRMLGTGTGIPEDPKDKRLGKITNPTVHIALGQFRRVMNMLIAEFGKPAEVVLEAARELSKSPKEKDEIDKRIRVNTKRNDRYREELEAEGLLQPGQRVGNRFLKMRLWEELGRTSAERCSPFSGRLIGLAELHSDAVEIEHILPFAQTFDDSPANKTLAFRDENRRKNKLSPGEAAARGIFDQDAMIARSKHFPRNKAWRFLPNAMELFEQQKSFDDRQLHATGYLARVVRAYAEALFDKTDADGKARNHVWMLPGRMTAMLRSRWGLHLPDHNRKNRNDHRHHAIDAAVIGVIDRGMIKRLQDAAKAVSANTLSRVLPHPPEPFLGYRDQVLAAVGRINISHRAKHGQVGRTDPSRTSGRLHEDTAYGFIRDVPENQAARAIGQVVVRKPTTELTDNEIKHIRDVKLRDCVLAETEPSRAGPSQNGHNKLRAELLTGWAGRTGHRRLRIIKANASARAVTDKTGRPYKYFVPGEISCIDLIETNGKWRGHAQSVWDANSGQAREWQEMWPDGRFIMRLHKEDTVQLFDWDEEKEAVVAGSNMIKRVVRLNPSANRIYLCGQYEAGSLQKRKDDCDDPFDWDLAGFDKLRLRRTRRVRIDELGRCHIIPHGKV